MATRLYFNSTPQTDHSIAIDASWTGAASTFDRYYLESTANSAFSTNTSTQSMSSGQSYCIGQWWSHPISNWAALGDFDTCSGTCLMRWTESATAANRVYKYLWRLYGDDGGWLYRSWYTGATEFDVGSPGTLESRRISGADWWAPGANGWSSNLRIILEIGYYKTSGTAASHTTNCEIGGNSGTDIPDNETTTSQWNPWFEMSFNATFDSEPSDGDVTPSRLMMLGVG